jgi:predicted metal-dependent phosphoesterase TrpH
MTGQYKQYWADLHIHSALSPCADDGMTPSAICEQAHRTGLSIIALTDHNSTLNCRAIMGYGSESFLIIPGMELQTREEVHLVCLFGTLEAALAWHDFVYQHLTLKPNRPAYFGNQLIFNHKGDICGDEPNLLLVSTDLSFEEAFRDIKKYHGRAIPAHIDRPSFSVIGNLGFLPPDLALNVVEISHHYTTAEFRKKFPQYAGCRLIQTSDAHRITEIGQGRSGFYLPELTREAFIKVLFQNS